MKAHPLSISGGRSQPAADPQPARATDPVVKVKAEGKGLFGQGGQVAQADQAGVKGVNIIGISGVAQTRHGAPMVAADDPGTAVDHFRQQVVAGAVKVLDRHPLNAGIEKTLDHGIHVQGHGCAGMRPEFCQKR